MISDLRVLMVDPGEQHHVKLSWRLFADVMTSCRHLHSLHATFVANMSPELFVTARENMTKLQYFYWAVPRGPSVAREVRALEEAFPMADIQVDDMSQLEL